LPILTSVKDFNDEVHIDFLGTYPSTTEGYKWILNIVDSFSNYMVLVPMVNATVFNMAKAIANNWIFKHGIPQTIVSDRGSNFLSRVADELSKTYGYNLKFTTAYNPQANGKVERSNRFIVERFRLIKLELNKIKPNLTYNWSDYLDYIAYVWNNLSTRNSNITPWEICNGTLNISLISLYNNLQNTQESLLNNTLPIQQQDFTIYINNKVKLLQDIAEKAKKNFNTYDKNRIQKFNEKLSYNQVKKFTKGELILIKNEANTGQFSKFSAKYKGPWKILKRNPNKITYYVQNVKYPDYKTYINVR